MPITATRASGAIRIFPRASHEKEPGVCPARLRRKRRYSTCSVGAPSGHTIPSLKLLRRVLYLEAGLLAVGGAVFLLVPEFLLTRFFHLAPLPEYIWPRIAGVEAFTLAMLMVLVAHRAEDLYWWSWAFVFVTASVSILILLKALLGFGPSNESKLWWIAGGGGVVLTVGLIWGLGKAGRANPIT